MRFRRSLKAKQGASRALVSETAVADSLSLSLYIYIEEMINGGGDDHQFFFSSFFLFFFFCMFTRTGSKSCDHFLMIEQFTEHGGKKNPPSSTEWFIF